MVLEAPQDAQAAVYARQNSLLYLDGNLGTLNPRTYYNEKRCSVNFTLPVAGTCQDT